MDSPPKPRALDRVCGCAGIGRQLRAQTMRSAGYGHGGSRGSQKVASRGSPRLPGSHIQRGLIAVPTEASSCSLDHGPEKL